MALRLAWQVGRADVDALLEEMGPAQWREWCAYFALEPWGPVQEDLRAGLLYSLLHNLWTEGKRLRPEDVFPSLREGGPAGAAKRPSAEELKLKAMHLCVAWGGVFKKASDSEASCQPASASSPPS